MSAAKTSKLVLCY